MTNYENIILEIENKINIINSILPYKENIVYRNIEYMSNDNNNNNTNDFIIKNINIDKIKQLLKLNNVDNTSDLNKPISLLQKTALDLKENISNKNMENGYAGLDDNKKIDSLQLSNINKSFAGLENVDNTSDLNKPISLLQKTALDLKENISNKNMENGYAGLDDNKKIDSLQLSNINKSFAGLENVDNTSDLNKPISLLQKTALDLKENISNKNMENGYAGLDDNKKIDPLQLSNIDKSFVGLENVDNTSDLNKPISLLQKTALDLKENISNKNMENGYVGLDDNKKIDLLQLPAIDKSFVGLENVDNTSDLNKPISTLQKTALDLKENISNKNMENGYVGLNDNKKIDLLQLPTIDKFFIGLENVDNTSDLNKPISTLQKTALDLKENISNKNMENGYVGLNINKKIDSLQLPTIDKSFVGLENVDNTSDLNKPISLLQKTTLDLKENILNKNMENGYAGLDVNKKIDLLQLSNIDKSFVGLENVDNTSDLNKPISLLQKTALELKENILNKNMENGYAGLDVNKKIDLLQLPTIDKSFVGLENVDNISDLNKPISLLQKTALDLKENILNKNMENGYAGLDVNKKIDLLQLPTIDKSFVGLENVDNTSDLNKPISLLQKTALDLKENILNKNMENGYAGLDVNKKIDLLQLPTIDKSFVGLENVDNTSDLNKPISLLQKTALDLKENILNKNMENGYAGLDVNKKIDLLQLPTIDKSFVGLENVDNTSDLNKPISLLQKTALDLKENILNKNMENGYAGLDVNKKIDPLQLPTIDKSFVGLENIDNTSDLNKPISTLQKTALDLKENISNKNMENGYAGLDANKKINILQLPDMYNLILTKANIGLGNVDNTSDVNKPISTAVQTALNLKENTSNKNVADGYAGLDASSKINSTQLPVLTKTLIGLENVDNTSDVNKPISTAVQTALNLKENTSNKNVTNGYVGLDASSKINSIQIPIITKTLIDLENVDNTSDLNKPISTAVQTALNLKENTSNKNIANGYVGLDASTKILTEQLPVLTKANFSDLGNVDNTSDLKKPISTAVQTALNLKENTSNKNVANGYAGLDASSKINSARLPVLTKTNFSDLGNVDNTSDVNKPISTAVQTALNLKENTANKNVANGYVGLDASSKINSIQLPVLTKTNTDLNLIDNTSDVNKPISTDVQTALNLKENIVNKNVAGGYAGLDASSKINSTQLPILTKTLIGLGNVDNTSDVDKSISTVVQTALNLKENTSNKNVANGYVGLDDSSKILTEQLPTLTKTNFSDLTNVDNTSDLNKPISTAVQTALNLKENTSNKNVANGYAGLDALSKINSTQLPNNINLSKTDISNKTSTMGFISGSIFSSNIIAIYNSSNSYITNDVVYYLNDDTNNYGFYYANKNIPANSTFNTTDWIFLGSLNRLRYSVILTNTSLTYEYNATANIVEYTKYNFNNATFIINETQYVANDVLNNGSFVMPRSGIISVYVQLFYSPYNLKLTVSESLQHYITITLPNGTSTNYNIVDFPSNGSSGQTHIFNLVKGSTISLTYTKYNNHFLAGGNRTQLRITSLD